MRTIWLILMWICGLVAIYYVGLVLWIIAEVGESAALEAGAADAMGPIIILGLLAVIFGVLARKGKSEHEPAAVNKRNALASETLVSCANGHEWASSLGYAFCPRCGHALKY